jgi:hypothetical protein
MSIYVSIILIINHISYIIYHILIIVGESSDSTRASLSYERGSLAIEREIDSFIIDDDATTTAAAA